MASVKKGPRVPRQSRSKDTVRTIVEATHRVLGVEGPDAVTTTRVAEVAGVGVGTLYRYFPSRGDLLAGAEEDSWAKQLSAVAEAMVALDGRPLGEAILELVPMVMNRIADSGRKHGFTMDPEARAKRYAIIEELTSFVTARLLASPDRAHLRPAEADLPFAVATAMRTVATFTWLGTVDHPDDMETGRWQRSIAEMVRAFLVKDA